MSGTYDCTDCFVLYISHYWSWRLIIKAYFWCFCAENGSVFCTVVKSSYLAYGIYFLRWEDAGCCVGLAHRCGLGVKVLVSQSVVCLGIRYLALSVFYRNVW